MNARDKVKRAGIKRVETNIDDGQHVVPPAGLCFAVFGDEIIEELRKLQELEQCERKSAT